MEVLLSFCLVVFFLALSPGPDNIYVLSVSIVEGFKYALYTILGLMTGCLIHTLLLSLGFSIIINKNDTLFYIIKSLGGFYLLFLAYKVYIDNNDVLLAEIKTERNLYKYYSRGITMNLLNPKVSLFFLALFPTFLFTNSLSTEIQFIILGSIFVIISFFVFSIIALLSSYFRNFLITNPKSTSFLKWTQFIVLVSLGIFVLFQKK